jgi:hypothetical protein
MQMTHRLHCMFRILLLIPFLHSHRGVHYIPNAVLVGSKPCQEEAALSKPPSGHNRSSTMGTTMIAMRPMNLTTVFLFFLATQTARQNDSKDTNHVIVLFRRNSLGKSKQVTSADGVDGFSILHNSRNVGLV